MTKATRTAATRDPYPAIAIGALTLLALALRLFQINAQSAWLDEAFTIHASASPWSAMMRILIEDFNHPPLHSMLVSWWFDVFGVGVFQARVLSAIFGTLAVPALYWLGRTLFDRRTALVAALLLTISQLGIVYSQEARGYSLLLLLSILATGFFVRALRTGDGVDFCGFVALSVLAVYTHYYAAFATVALLLGAVWFRRRSLIPAWWWAAAAVFAVVAYLPWLISGVVQSALANPQGAINNKLFAPFAAPLYALNWFNNGKLAGIRAESPWWAFPLGCLIFTAPALYALRLVRRRGEFDGQAVALLALCGVVPVAIVSALGLLHLIYDVRHISFVVAPYYLLVARGVTMVRTAAIRNAIVGAIVLYSALSFPADYFMPYKENYRDALKVVASQSAAGDCTIFGAPDGNSFGQLYWDSYYHPNEPPALIRVDQAAARSDCRRVWLVWDTMWWKAGAQTPASVGAQLAPTYRPSQRSSFTGVDVQLYVRQPE